MQPCLWCAYRFLPLLNVAEAALAEVEADSAVAEAGDSAEVASAAALAAWCPRQGSVALSQDGVLLALFVRALLGRALFSRAPTPDLE